MREGKIEKGVLFCQEIIEGWGNEGWKFFVVNLFSPKANWCCPEGKSFEFFFSNEELVVPRDNLCPEGRRVSSKSPEGHKLSRGTTSSSERKKTQRTFPKDNISLLKEKINWQQKISIPNFIILLWSRGKTNHCLNFPFSHNFESFFKFYFIASYASVNFVTRQADFPSLLLNFKWLQWWFQQLMDEF